MHIHVKGHDEKFLFELEIPSTVAYINEKKYIRLLNEADC